MPFVFNLSGLTSASPLWQSLVSPAITFAGTLVVVWLTNRYASKNLRTQRSLDDQRVREQWQDVALREREQRAHDAAEALKERTTQKRRDVCLRAIDALARLQAHMATMATRFEDYDQKPLQDFVAAAAQAEVVVEPTTAVFVRKLASEVGRLNMKLMIQRIPLHKAHTRLQRLRAMDQKIVGMKGAISALENMFNREMISFYEYMFRSMKDLIPARVDALTAVRRDLELSVEDPEVLRAYLEQDYSEMLRLFQETVEKANQG